MDIIYYQSNPNNKIEDKLKDLALEKGYKFDTKKEVLNETEILKSNAKGYREMLKEYGDEATITVYSITHRKDNYFIFLGQPKDKDIVGITVIHHQKLLKQFGKLALAVPFIAASGVIGLAIGTALTISGAKRTFSIKGPLGKNIKKIIEETFAEPITNKQ